MCTVVVVCVMVMCSVSWLWVGSIPVSTGAYWFRCMLVLLAVVYVGFATGDGDGDGKEDVGRWRGLETWDDLPGRAVTRLSRSTSMYCSRLQTVGFGHILRAVKGRD